MRKADSDLPPDATRQQAAEVQELGQTLFDAVIEAVSSPAAGDATGLAEKSDLSPASSTYRGGETHLLLNHTASRPALPPGSLSCHPTD